MKICSQCGAAQDDDAVFCNKCGSSFNNAVIPPQQPMYQQPSYGRPSDHAPVQNAAPVYPNAATKGPNPQQAGSTSTNGRRGGDSDDSYMDIMKIFNNK